MASASKRDHGAPTAAASETLLCVSERSRSLAAPAEHHAPAGKSAKMQHEEDTKARRCRLFAALCGPLGGRGSQRAGLAVQRGTLSASPGSTVQAFMDVYKTLSNEIIADEVADNQARQAAAVRMRRSPCSRTLRVRRPAMRSLGCGR